MNCEQGFGVYNCSTVVVTRLAINQNTLVMRAKQRGDAISLKKYANVGERITLLYGSFIWRGHSTVTEEIGWRPNTNRNAFPVCNKGWIKFFSMRKGWFQFAIIPCAFLSFLLTRHNEKRAGAHRNSKFCGVVGGKLHCRVKIAFCRS